MDLFDVLSLIGGLSLFLFGMNFMGEALERRAGGTLKRTLGRLTTNPWAGLLTGLAVTAVIQSSSATTVMVVGFVNSGMMSLEQAINVIMGANIGTTVTAWILSLTGIESTNVFVRLLKPSSFTPVLALIGIIMYMVGRTDNKKMTGAILLGFATLMFGMETMSSAVSGLRYEPSFENILIKFSNPILGVLAGALLTAIIQSSSASVGILQALASTGQVTLGTAIPIIMGQNIGTCVTALISSIGTNKNAKRAAVVHLTFNVIGTIVWLTVFCILKSVLSIPALTEGVNELGIAIVHSSFNILCVALMFPMRRLLIRISYFIVPDSKRESDYAVTKLDERLMKTPAIAIEQCENVTSEMAKSVVSAFEHAVSALRLYNADLAADVRRKEENSDEVEDEVGTYLVKLSSQPLSSDESSESGKILRVITDFERIADHAVNILESAEEVEEKQIRFSRAGSEEMQMMENAVTEILHLALQAYTENDLEAAKKVEPLEQVIDTLKEQLRARHVTRLQSGECSIPAGFVLNDLVTDLERVSDHCSNIAGCVIETQSRKLDLHNYLEVVRRRAPDYDKQYDAYTEKYRLDPPVQARRALEEAEENEEKA